MIDSTIAAAKAGNLRAEALDEGIRSSPAGAPEQARVTEEATGPEPLPLAEGVGHVESPDEPEVALGPDGPDPEAVATVTGGPRNSAPGSAGTSDRDAQAAQPEDAGGLSPKPVQPELAPAGLATAPWTWEAKATLIASFSAVEGVSAKLANMSLAALMIGGRPKDPDWFAVASLMVTVDSLINNVLARTGVLAAFGAEHAYGPRCYGPNGCEAVMYELTEAIRTRETAPNLDIGHPAGPGTTNQPPLLTPIEVQKALWRFCTAGVLNYCNAARVGQGPGCNTSDCPVREHCRRAHAGAPASE